MNTFTEIEPIITKTGIRKYHKEITIIKTDLSKSELVERYEKGVRLKRSILLLEQEIKKREDRLKELEKTKIFKEIKNNFDMIKTTHKHIRYEYRKFLELYE